MCLYFSCFALMFRRLSIFVFFVVICFCYCVHVQKTNVRYSIDTGDEKLEEFAELLTEDWKNHQETGTVRF